MKYLIALIILAGLLALSTPEQMLVAQSPPEDTALRARDGKTLSRARDSKSLLRTRDSKTFDIGGGFREVVFGNNLHYNDNGEWKDVALGFRNGVSELASVIVDITGRNLTLTERDTGIGIKYTLPENPIVGDRTLTYNYKGLVWTYDLTKAGLKLSSAVSSSKGNTTYAFPFTFLGTSGNLNNGRLETDEFVVERPTVIEADGTVHRYNWTQDAGEIKFTFDDTGFALPYTIDPTTEFDIAASGDDAEAYSDRESWTPSCDGVDTSDDSITVEKDDVGSGDFSIKVGFVRWDTGSIPDTATITSASFEPYVRNAKDDDSRNFVGEYYTSWPLTCSGDWTATVGTNAFTEDITGISDGQRHTIALSNLSNISLTTYTGLRLGISGGKPTDENQVRMDSFDDDDNDPRLSVTYTIDPTVSTYSPNQVDDGTTEAVTVTGTDFESTAQLIMQKSGESNIACTGESVNGPGTQLTATCDFTSVALGLWDAQVDNGSGNTDTLSDATEVFAVVTVTAVSPSAVAANGTKTLTLTGTEFTSSATSRLEKSGESNINCTLNTSTSSVSIDIDCGVTGAADGLWNIRVTTSTATNGLGSNLLDVQTLNVTSITPNTEVSTGVESFTVAGDGFDSGAAVRLEKSGESNIVCTSVVVVSLTSITMDCDLTGVASGFWNLRATNSPSSATALLTNALSVSNVITLLATGVSSGDHTVLLRADGSQIELLLDGTVEATYAGTANVIDNANSWDMFENGAMPYVESAKITIDSISQLHYELDALPGYQLVDRSGEGHDAAIRFPDTPVGLTVALGSTEATVSTDGTSASNLEVIGAIPAIKNYTDVPDADAGWWVFEVIDIFTNGLLPYQAMTTIFSLAVIGTGAVFAAKFLRHALLVGLVMIALVAIMWLLGATPGWWLWLLAISPFPMFLMWKRMNP